MKWEYDILSKNRFLYDDTAFHNYII
jgi:hypothetical protein